MRPYPYNLIFLDRDAPARRQVGVAVQLLLCCGARPSWPQCLLRPGHSRAGVDWSAAILAAVLSMWVECVRGLFDREGRAP